MAVIVNGVVGKERWEGFRKGRAMDGPYVVYEYLVDAADADAFADGVMGGIVVSGGTVRNLTRHQCPTNKTLYALNAEVSYFGETNPTGGGRPTFSEAVVTVQYGNLTWPQAFGDDPGGVQSFPVEATPGQPLLFAECEIDYGGELVTVPQGSLVFLSDSKPIDAPVGKWVGITTFRITRHNYPNLPHSKVVSLQNRLNNTTFLGQARGTVRFAGARTKLVMTADGTRCQNFEMTFEIREYDWNEFMRPDDMTFDTVGSPTDSTKQPYKYDNLAGLIS